MRKKNHYCASHGEFGQHLQLPQGDRSFPKSRRRRLRNFSTTFIAQLCIQVVQFSYSTTRAHVNVCKRCQ